MSQIKRGVSLYSYQQEYFLGMMSLEDCIKAVSDTGATGVELLGEMMIPDYPNMTDAFVDQWFEWMEQYHVEPSCYDGFIDWDMYKDHSLSAEDGAEIMKRDMLIAHRLGFKNFRVISSTPLKYVAPCLDLAKELDMYLGFEIHSPIAIGDDWYEERIEFIKEHKTEHLGFVPDMSIFVSQIPEHKTKREIASGTDEKIVLFINEAYKNKADYNETKDAIIKMGAGEAEMHWLEEAYHFSNGDLNDLLKVLPYTRTIHGKFYKMNERSEDNAIDYAAIIELLAANGYDGYIASEYEGFEYAVYDSLEQVSRQHNLFKKILEKY